MKNLFLRNKSDELFEDLFKDLVDDIKMLQIHDNNIINETMYEIIVRRRNTIAEFLSYDEYDLRTMWRVTPSVLKMLQSLQEEIREFYKDKLS